MTLERHKGGNKEVRCKGLSVDLRFEFIAGRGGGRCGGVLGIGRDGGVTGGSSLLVCVRCGWRMTLIGGSRRSGRWRRRCSQHFKWQVLCNRVIQGDVESQEVPKSRAQGQVEFKVHSEYVCVIDQLQCLGHAIDVCSRKPLTIQTLLHVLWQDDIIELKPCRCM
jgi:hypothetical protein